MAKVPKAVKDSVWKKYVGNNTESKCYCCGLETINVFNFEVGHNKARSKGGSNDVENLRPICKTCNTSMGTKSIESFRAKHFSSTHRNTSDEPNTIKRKAVVRKLLTKQHLNELTLVQLKYLAVKHSIKVSGTVWEDIWGNTTRQAPTKRQYVNKLYGVIYEGEI